MCLGAVELAPLVKCLTYKHEDLSWSHGKHIKVGCYDENL